MSESHSIADSHADPISIHGGSVDRVKEELAGQRKTDSYYRSKARALKIIRLISPIYWKSKKAKALPSRSAIFFFIASISMRAPMPAGFLGRRCHFDQTEAESGALAPTELSSSAKTSTKIEKECRLVSKDARIFHKKRNSYSSPTNYHYHAQSI
uniref:hypothetical protein n=1 Tax=Jatropha curcas TaxID=180498 RepID=UPI00279EEAB7|nr:hypothetical protein QLP06_mgp001 [Jatropha curcas]WFG81116.1 hypothetical protein [Jatropha curcas]